MVQLIALTVGSLAGFLPHLLFGTHLSVFADFLLGSVAGGIAYVVAVYQLRKLRGDF